MERPISRAGLLYGLTAYGLWGLIPIYFTIAGRLSNTGPGYEVSLELLAHRIVWSLTLLVILLSVWGRWSQLPGILTNRQTMIMLLATTALIGVNWYVNTYAMSSSYIMQASLGYYITPLLNTLMGFFVLRERPRPLQWTAVGIAFVGVMIYATYADGPLWISLTLALSFGFYGLLRKTVGVDGIWGLSIECALLLPAAALYLGYLEFTDSSHYTISRPAVATVLIASGVVTVIPLGCFVTAARLLPLGTVGMLQYIAPSLQFIVGLVTEEPFTAAKVVCFAFIWVAVSLYCFDLYLTSRQTSDPEPDDATSADAPEPPLKASLEKSP